MKPVLLFILGAVPMSVFGADSFVEVPKEIISRLIGLAIILFLLLKFFNILKFDPNNSTVILGGGITGFVSGLVGSAGPIGAALFLSLDLPPVSYIASEAMTAIAMHLTKIIVYERYLGIGLPALSIGFFMGVSMVLGTWAGMRIIKNISRDKFNKFVGTLLCIIGLKRPLFGSEL